MRIAFSPAARVDLLDIHDFISAKNPSAADRFVDELQATCRDLANLPDRFPIVGKFNGRDTRRRTYRDYLILYLVLEGAVVIVRVIHGARNLAALLD